MASRRNAQDARRAAHEAGCVVSADEPRGRATGDSGASYTVAIPGWLPVSVNALLRLHWSKRSKVKRADAAVVAAHCNAADVPKATGKRRVRLIFRQPMGRLGDADNRLKSILDALTAAGRLVDDSPVWCQLGAVQVERGPKVTVIDLADID